MASKPEQIVPRNAPIEGESYRREGVHVSWGDMPAAWWPILGKPHRDAEILQVPQMHSHVDWRFVPEEQYRWAVERLCEKIGWALRGSMVDEPPDYVHQELLGTAIFTEKAEIEVRKTTCLREHLPRWLPGPKPVGWRRTLAGAYWKPLKRNRDGQLLCPHRGMDLDEVAIGRDGILECPIHGLRWDTATGNPVPPPDCRRRMSPQERIWLTRPRRRPEALRALEMRERMKAKQKEKYKC